MILIAPKFLKIFTRNFAVAMTIWPFILIRKQDQKRDIVLLRHESIHLRQQLEMLIILFYIWYGLEYLIRRMRSTSHEETYMKISFEKEAFAQECTMGYLKKRPFWGFLKYV